MIVTLLLRNQGFYSILFFVLNHYLYCKKNKLNYKMNTDNWLFKSINGWTDYFENIELNYDDDITKEIVYYDQKNTILDNFTLNDYRNAISEVYIYNKNTKERIIEIKKKFNLLNNYSSIFIRRGDKLISESNLYNASNYIELLLKKDPKCKRIFIQTDDYNSVIEAKHFIEIQNLDIEIITLCNENTKGMVIISHQQNMLNNVLHNISYSKNTDYLFYNKNDLLNFKPVDKMNSTEIYEHTIQMLIGIDIVLNSNICILDYESNISRFIKLAHCNPNNVLDINNMHFDFKSVNFPAYGFNF
jgi:hypothetical protein